MIEYIVLLSWNRHSSQICFNHLQTSTADKSKTVDALTDACLHFNDLLVVKVSNVGQGKSLPCLIPVTTHNAIKQYCNDPGKAVK